jgi:WXG100 family type VII secretion target
MAEQIRISPEQMETRAAEYHTEGDHLGDIITKMDTLLTALQGEWEGAASQAYAARYAELKPGFIKARDLIFEIETALKQTAQTLAETDSNIASAFRG